MFKQFCFHTFQLCLPAAMLGFTACQAQELATVEQLQGSYKYTVTNSLMTGDKYSAENQLLLMKTSPNTAYFETHLKWANGHSCDFFGIANVASPTQLIYSTSSIMDKTCTFNINIKKDKFIFADSDGACRLISCGTRGGLDGVEFQLNTKQPINPDTIKSTPNYIDAINEFNSKVKQKTRN